MVFLVSSLLTSVEAQNSTEGSNSTNSDDEATTVADDSETTEDTSDSAANSSSSAEADNSSTAVVDTTTSATTTTTIATDAGDAGTGGREGDDGSAATSKSDEETTSGLYQEFFSILFVLSYRLKTIPVTFIKKSLVRASFFYFAHAYGVMTYLLVVSLFCFILFYLPLLSSIHEKANCIAILWTVSPHSLGSCLFRDLWPTCLPHKGGASR